MGFSRQEYWGGVPSPSLEFQVRKVKNSGGGWWWEWHNNADVLSATELCSYTWLKQYVLYYVTFTTMKNVKKKSYNDSDAAASCLNSTFWVLLALSVSTSASSRWVRNCFCSFIDGDMGKVKEIPVQAGSDWNQLAWVPPSFCHCLRQGKLGFLELSFLIWMYFMIHKILCI